MLEREEHALAGMRPQFGRQKGGKNAGGLGGWRMNFIRGERESRTLKEGVALQLTHFSWPMHKLLFVSIQRTYFLYFTVIQ